MNENKRKAKALGLCSGGLDSTLAGVVLKRQGVEVVWVAFETPFFNAARAKKASEATGIPLVVRDITERYLPMLKNPPAGYGRQMNPCMDCHALMFRIAGEMMDEVGADFLFSGEVTGQRPMSQTRSSLRYVEKHSAFDGLILRPLSAKRLPETEMEKTGLVDREQLLDFSGRSRKPQMALAESLGITDYPAPAGGCLLTDPNFSRRARDLIDFVPDAEKTDFLLLGHGRHIRISSDAKLVVGRNKSDNAMLLSLYRPEQDVKIFMHDVPGPVGLVPRGAPESDVRTAAALCAGYTRAPADLPARVQVDSPKGNSQREVVPLKAVHVGLEVI